MIYNKAINDMSYGWISENEDNKRIYKLWYNMLRRCYCEKYHKTHPTYKDCYVCNRWLMLSNFVEDVKLISGYNLWLKNSNYQLDKDIKSNGKNKCYCLEECMFVDRSENSIQSNKTMNYDFMKNRIGEKHPNYGKQLSNEHKRKISESLKGENNHQAKKVVQYDKQGNLIKIWDYIKQVEKELKISSQNISKCCQFYEMNCDKEKWFKIHNENPRKSVGGFIWKYYNLGDEENGNL